MDALWSLFEHMGAQERGAHAWGRVCPQPDQGQAPLAEAYERLLLTRGRELQGFVRRFVADEALADDILQEVGLVVLASSTPPEEISDLMAFAKGVAKRKALRMLSLRKREVSSDSFDELSEVGSGEERVATRQILSRVLPELRDSSADLLYRRHILEENATEIGKRSGLSSAAVRMKLKRALSLVRDALSSSPS